MDMANRASPLRPESYGVLGQPILHSMSIAVNSEGSFTQQSKSLDLRFVELRCDGLTDAYLTRHEASRSRCEGWSGWNLQLQANGRSTGGWMV